MDLCDSVRERVVKGQGQHTLSPSRYFYRFRQKKRHSRAWANDNPENPVCHNYLGDPVSPVLSFRQSSSQTRFGSGSHLVLIQVQLSHVLIALIFTIKNKKSY